MHCDRREVALAEQLVELCASSSALDEDNDLVKFKLIEQFIESTILLGFGKTNVVLLQTVKGQFGVIIDVELKWILHELLANWSSGLRQGGAEHHDLLLGGSCAEDFLDIATHILKSQIDHDFEDEDKYTYRLGRASCHTHQG
jgi:hypothetical protein